MKNIDLNQVKTKTTESLRFYITRYFHHFPSALIEMRIIPLVSVGDVFNNFLNALKKCQLS
jgi:hypothetical protein